MLCGTSGLGLGASTYGWALRGSIQGSNHDVQTWALGCPDPMWDNVGVMQLLHRMNTVTFNPQPPYGFKVFCTNPQPPKPLNPKTLHGVLESFRL